MEMQMQMHKSALEDWLKVVFLVIWTINAKIWFRLWLIKKEYIQVECVPPALHHMAGVDLSWKSPWIGQRPSWKHTTLDIEHQIETPWTETSLDRNPLDRGPWSETPWTEIPVQRTPLDRDPLNRELPEQRPSGKNMGLETGTLWKMTPRRNMGPGSHTRSDIIQRPSPRVWGSIHVRGNFFSKFILL